jgi:hypothetical protein
MNDPRDLVAADPELQQAITALVETFSPEGVCEVCHEQDDSVSSPCGALVLVQMCEHCHWMTCPEGGECL